MGHAEIREVYVAAFNSVVDGTVIVGSTADFMLVQIMCERHLAVALPSFRLLNFKAQDVEVGPDAVMCGYYPVVHADTPTDQDLGPTATSFQIYSTILLEKTAV